MQLPTRAQQYWHEYTPAMHFKNIRSQTHGPLKPGERIMLMRLKIVVFLAGLMMIGSVAALQPPTVEYSADTYMETADGVMKGRVNYAPGKERREYVESGEKMIMIIRHDKKRTWMLMPEDKIYMDTQAGGGRKGDLTGYQIDQTRVGEETVNGVRATKYKIIMTGPKGDKFGGFFWATREDIVMKMDAISVDKGSKERIKMELKNLKIGSQPPSLFEIPAGYSAGMPGMGGLGGMMKDVDDKDGEKQPQKKGETKGFGWKDALDLLK